MFTQENIISAYTRAEAMLDGQLIEIPNALLREAGIILPSVISVDLQNALVPSEKDVGNGQSLEGRLWDMIMIFRVVAKGSNESFCRFPLHLETEGRQRVEEVVVACGPDDFGNPCLTFMTPSCV